MFVGAIALLVVACGGDDPTPTTRPPTATVAPAPTETAVPANAGDGAEADSVTITLTALNDSAQDGTAILTASGSQTVVVVDIAAGADGVAHPIHIHSGTCDTLGGVEYPLESLQGGESTRTVDASLDSLLSGTFAINGHKSGPEVAVYISCGEINSGDTLAMADGSSEVASVIQNFTLEDLTVTVGSTVVWTNLDGFSHTSTGGTSPVADGSWDSGDLGNQSTSPVAFNEVGSFPYFCTIHPGMQATVTVVA
jgi:plastocyanin